MVCWGTKYNYNTTGTLCEFLLKQNFGWNIAKCPFEMIYSREMSKALVRLLNSTLALCFALFKNLSEKLQINQSQWKWWKIHGVERISGLEAAICRLYFVLSFYAYWKESMSIKPEEQVGRITTIHTNFMDFQCCLSHKANQKLLRKISASVPFAFHWWRWKILMCFPFQHTLFEITSIEWRPRRTDRWHFESAF